MCCSTLSRVFLLNNISAQFLSIRRVSKLRSSVLSLLMFAAARYVVWPSTRHFSIKLQAGLQLSVHYPRYYLSLAICKIMGFGHGRGTNWQAV